MVYCESCPDEVVIDALEGSKSVMLIMKKEILILLDGAHKRGGVPHAFPSHRDTREKDY